MEPGNKSHASLVVGPVPGESGTEFRARIALRAAEALARRQLELAGQTANHHSPAERIRIWERLHQIMLPRDPAHQLLHVIASDTALTLEEVHIEQQQRKAPPADIEA
jgi:hypothetical protein